MRRTPASLYPKREEKGTLGNVFEEFIVSYGGILFCLAIAFALILFVSIVMATAPPTESGVYYNHLN